MYQWCPDLEHLDSNLAPLSTDDEGLQGQFGVGDAGSVDFSEDHHYDLLGEGVDVDHGGGLTLVVLAFTVSLGYAVGIKKGDEFA